MENQESQTDILIVGGGVGGCAAALAACENGLSVILTEESDWLGGQFTSQATPPDEHGWIEDTGCTRSYRKFRRDVRDFYRNNRPLTKSARNNPILNPGDGWVSPLCAEPKVFLQIFETLLKPFVKSGKLKILLDHFPMRAQILGNAINGVTLENLRNKHETSITAKYFVDATELGELLPLTDAEFATGSESRRETGEPSAKDADAATNSQAFSVCFAMSYHAGENHTIARPQNYDFWRDFVPPIMPPWSGKLLSLTGLNPRDLTPVHYNFQPNCEPNRAFAGLWTYRRILHAKNFQNGAFDSDITLVNYPQIDFLLGDLTNAKNYDEKQAIVSQAKQQSLSFLYFLQTELGFKGLKLREDTVETADGLAKMPYIRESRRIKAEFTVLEQHVSAAARPEETRAEKFADSVGVGFYRIDLHPTVGGDNYVDVEALPFQIPLGALIPKRVENLLAACKNIGTTHITNGCYRLHPIEWNIGEAAGNLLSFCLRNDLTPKMVRNDPGVLRDFQRELIEKGFELEWRENLNLANGDPHRFAM